MNLQLRPERLLLATGLVLLVPLASAQETASADPRASLRSAYEAARYAVAESGDGYVARNPGQRWGTRFDGRGFTTTPDDGGWEWGLELESFGFAGAERIVGGRAPARVEGTRVAYDWDAALEEWYVNDARGLEHGYTLHERPSGAGETESPLSFTLAVRGGLCAEVDADGRGVRFHDGDGASVITYAGLAVFDADGRDLPARFERAGTRLRLIVHEEGARYPVTIDPIAQQAYLKASNTQADDRFGIAVSVSGDTAVIGAEFEDSASAGVNGEQADEGATWSGAAYVFVRNGTSWSQQAYLKASNPSSHDRFGACVSISGDTIVVGAPYEDSAATGVDGDQGDTFEGRDSGAAYVFVRNGTSWSQQAYLKASNSGRDDSFGVSVSVSGDTVVVGATDEDSGATGVNGDQSSESVDDSGAAYVFVRTGSAWSQQAYLKASTTDISDLFGGAVAVSGDTLIIGAAGEDSAAAGVNGDQGNDSLASSGAAYAFARTGTDWVQEAYLKASSPGYFDFFGVSLSLSGDTVVVGAVLEDSSATGVDGDAGDETAVDSGAAYAFVRNGTTWSLQAYLKASNTGDGDWFGTSVSLSGDTLVVGAPGEASDATGADGDQENDDAFRSGAAYIFVREGSIWIQHAWLKASNTGATDVFGKSVSISGDTVLAGADQEDSDATGVNGDQSDEHADDSGAVYAFHLDPPDGPGAPSCFGDGSGTPCPCGNASASGGCANSSGSGCILDDTGSSSISAGDLALIATNALPGQPGIFFQGDSSIAGGAGVPFGDGLRCAGVNVVRLQVVVPNANGDAVSSPNVGAEGGVAIGDLRHYQYWYRDPIGGPCGTGFNLSNVLSVTWAP